MIEMYEDIIAMPHHQSSCRPHMDLGSRAAQFAPFAALSGFGESIRETARTTESERVLDELRIQEINDKLDFIKENFGGHSAVKITYFVKDRYKAGGSYQTAVKDIKKIDEYNKQLIFTDGEKIKLNSIYDINVI